MKEKLILAIRDNEDGDNLWAILIEQKDLDKAKQEIELIKEKWQDDDLNITCCLQELLKAEMTFKYEEIRYDEIFI